MSVDYDITMKIASIISHMFSAPIFAIYCVIIVSLIEPSVFNIPIWLAFLVSFLFLSVFPVIKIIIDARKGKVDLDVQDREKRPRYFLYAMASHLTGALISLYLGSVFLFGFIISYFFVTLSLLIGNHYTKVSVHTSGVVGPITFLIFAVNYNFIILYTLVFPVLWARIKLNAHTFIQTLLGIAFSVVTTTFTYFFVYKIVC